MNPQNGESWTGPAALGFADRGMSSVHSCPWSCSQVLQPCTATAGGAALVPATSKGALPAKPASHPAQLPPCRDRRPWWQGAGATSSLLWLFLRSWNSPLRLQSFWSTGRPSRSPPGFLAPQLGLEAPSRDAGTGGATFLQPQHLETVYLVWSMKICLDDFAISGELDANF